MPLEDESKLVDKPILSDASRLALAKVQAYHVVDQNGKRITLTRELFTALNDFLGNTEKRSGSMRIEFANGGVARVMAERVYK